MGIESDQLVFDYLSRVGDLAQQRQLPSGVRMRLVSELRGEIERRRAKGPDGPVAVRRILDRLGTPDDLVEAAANPSGDAAASPAAAAPQPEPRRPEPRKPEPRLSASLRSEASRRLRRVVPRPRSAAEAAPAPAPAPEPPTAPRPTPPHLLGLDELGDSAPDIEPDWWRVQHSPSEGVEGAPGFVGGIEIPEMLKRPPVDMAKPGTGTEKAADAERDRLRKPPGPRKPTAYEEPEEAEESEESEESGAEGAGGSAARGREATPVLGALASIRSLSNPLLLLAAAALVVGAAIGNWFALGGGWVIAWFSKKLSRAEVKCAVIGMPALSVAGGIAWLWGRSQGKWGEPIAKGHMNEALSGTWPWVVRGAAIGSALFLVWRSQRQRPAGEPGEGE
ncbi:hypothetical protein [Streptomyces sp. G45]|uniref:hypothetical protein n=1 Tax=Streptomyces sp. G45 TaxID=3406627 RepID=UPI003C2A8165